MSPPYRTMDDLYKSLALFNEPIEGPPPEGTPTGRMSPGGCWIAADGEWRAYAGTDVTHRVLELLFGLYPQAEITFRTNGRRLQLEARLGNAIFYCRSAGLAAQLWAVAEFLHRRSTCGD